jgi:hypothetical protein
MTVTSATWSAPATTLPGVQPLTPEQVAQSIFSLNYSLRDQGHAITTLRDETRYNTQQIQQLSEEFQMLRHFLMGAPLPPPPLQ